MKRLPAQTSTSLLAKATMRPRRIAARVGASPAAPTMPAITQSAGRSAASTSASRPARRLDPACRRAPPSAPDSPPDRRPRQSARRAPRLFGQERRVAVGGQRLDGERVAVAQQQIDGALPDRPGRAENRDAARPRAPIACRRLGRQTGPSSPCQHAAAADHGQQRHRRDHREQAVEPVEQAAMSGDEAARVLHAEPSLGHGLQQDRRTARQSQALR